MAEQKKRAPRKRNTKATSTPVKVEPENPLAIRGHRIIDHVVAAERARGTSNRASSLNRE